MLARTNMALVGAALLALLCTGPANADLSDLPVGHLKIKDGQNGTINVEARCVPLQSLIEEMCRRLGKQPLFESPCLVYSSVYRPDVFHAPDQWLDLMEGDGVHCILDKNRCTVRSLGQLTGYHVNLPEEMIRTVLPLPIPEAVTPKEGITGSVFVYAGTYVRAPYLVECRVEPDKSWRLTVNGIVVRTIPPRKQPAKPKDVQLPPSGQFEDRMDLMRYVDRVVYPRALAEGLGQSGALNAVKEFLKTQSVVEEVLEEKNKDTYRGRVKHFASGPLQIIMKGFPGEAECVFSSDYDFKNGLVPNARIVDLPDDALAKRNADEFTQMFRGGNVVFCYAAGGRGCFPGETYAARLIKALDAARALPLLQAECILGEVVTDRLTARYMAVRLLPDCPEFRTALEALVRR